MAKVVETSGLEIQRGKMSHSYEIQENIPLFQEVDEGLPALLYLPRRHTINPRHKIQPGVTRSLQPKRVYMICKKYLYMVLNGFS